MLNEICKIKSNKMLNEIGCSNNLFISLCFLIKKRCIYLFIAVFITCCIYLILYLFNAVFISCHFYLFNMTHPELHIFQLLQCNVKAVSDHCTVMDTFVGTLPERLMSRENHKDGNRSFRARPTFLTAPGTVASGALHLRHCTKKLPFAKKRSATRNICWM